MTKDYESMDILKEVCEENPTLWEQYYTFEDDLRTTLGLFKIMDINAFLPKGSKIDIPEPMLRNLQEIAGRYQIECWKKSYFLIKLHLHQFVPEHGTKSQREHAVAHAASITGLLNEFEFWVALAGAKDFVPYFFDDSTELLYMECEGNA